MEELWQFLNGLLQGSVDRLLNCVRLEELAIDGHGEVLGELGQRHQRGQRKAEQQNRLGRQLLAAREPRKAQAQQTQLQLERERQTADLLDGGDNVGALVPDELAGRAV